MKWMETSYQYHVETGHLSKQEALCVCMAIQTSYLNSKRQMGRDDYDVFCISLSVTAVKKQSTD